MRRSLSIKRLVLGKDDRLTYVLGRRSDRNIGAVNCAPFMDLDLAAARLKALTRAAPMQSSDAALDRAIGRLEESAARIRADYPAG